MHHELVAGKLEADLETGAGFWISFLFFPTKNQLSCG
jgi:hypothetical protein